MAKWGQGDPRWIVEERPDATNVNNWHWAEKDAGSWSRSKLKSLLVGLKFSGEEGECEITEALKVDGEATAHNRKGKLIFFYDWSIKLKWSGMAEGKEGEVKGEIEIPNLSDENAVEEVDVIVTVESSGKVVSQTMKEMVHREAPIVVRSKLSEYLRCLKEEYSNKGLILPKRQSPTESSPATPPTLGTRISTQRSPSPAATSNKKSGTVNVNTTQIKMTESFMTSIEELYNTLTTQQLVATFTNSSTKLEAKKGGLYSLLDGLISGQYMELEKPHKIVKTWREKSWPDAHYSTVTIELNQEQDCAKLVLLHTNVPEGVAERTKLGWKTHIFERIKSVFGYGARLF
ncbi:Activator of 90 kDa heat shock protein ATPase homolog 1 [Geodia barretti]|uniref:Activator of 90 kDa heat shock protein ATPase homolog 1 n=2 Tax=Geodia barretti TaxID=519541 RepID=A0AA35RHL5_GEOBA|nr:Activator of 90 kDa heat shock protein ATPase homolog 1 [Geodia barretti]